MPALKPREKLANGKLASALSAGTSSSSGVQQEQAQAAGYLKKKLMLLEENEQNAFGGDHNNNKQRGNEQQEETYEDVCTIGGAHINDEEPMIFGRVNSSINQTAKDQFAAALLRLQADLDATSKKLTELEGKLGQFGKQQASNNRTAAAAATSKGGFFSRANLTSLVYIGWPVVVLFAIRTLERRSLANKVTA